MNRTSINAEKVLEGLSPTNYRISHKDVIGVSWIIPSKFTVRFFTFENCTFNDEVKIGGFDDLVGFQFIDCIFNHKFSTNDISITGIEENNEDISNGLFFKNCNFHNSFKLTFKQSIHGISFSNNTFYDECLISGGGFDEIRYMSFMIHNNTFKASTFIRKSEGLYYFRENTFEGQCLVQPNSVNETVSKFEIISGNFNKGLFFLGSKDKTFRDKDRNEKPFINKISHLNIHCSEQLFGNIYCQDYIIDSLKISGINSRSNIVFSNIQIEKIYFSDLTNLANIQFLSIVPEGDSTLTIKKSNLGKAQFSGCEFDKLQKVSIQGSIVQDIISVDTDWFTLNVLNPDLKTKNDFRNKREVFRQLKLSAEKQSDRIRALQFKAQEYYSFEKELFSSKSRWNDKIILWLSKTNSHGQNWAKPSVWLIALTIFFGTMLILIYSPLLEFSLSFKVNDIQTTFSEIWLQKKAIIQILNPVHKLSDIFGEGKTFSGWLYGIDLFYRIVYAFFVFQIVSAFRKYVK
ncbi:MAG: hypothetical protein CVU05_06345 [Bacteroidetes bacterium HGW-Bacteroidetes-21]|nr:MAG: hypothetical protein CVU05_06345 [Bacteroidetes bacterium HGW-Bacteroidetes-21]